MSLYSCDFVIVVCEREGGRGREREGGNGRGRETEEVVTKLL